MSLVKSNSFFPGRVFSTLFDDVFTRNFHELAKNGFHNMPAVNIAETAEGYQIEMAAPGLQKSDFTLSVDKDQLVISTASKKEEESTEQDGKWTRKEFNYTSFKRSFYLDQSIDVDKILAEYTNGILHVTLPKKEEAKEKAVKTIEIQ